MSKKIQTVCGPISPDELGFTQPHEHTLIDYHGDPGNPDRNFYSADRVVYEENLVINELKYFTDAGGKSIVDVTSIGLGRNPEGVKRISEASGVNIILGSGWYLKNHYPDYIWKRSADTLASMIIKEFKEGIGETGIKPGIIGEIGTYRNFISPAEERIFRACSTAQRETGAAITTHTTHFGELALEQIEIFKKENVNMSRVIIGHLGSCFDIQPYLPIAETGVWLQIDQIGFTPPLVPLTEEQRVNNAIALIEKGHLNKIMLSLDICFNSHFHYFGGRGYDYLIKKFLPIFRKRGGTEEMIHTMMVENPSKALAF